METYVLEYQVKLCTKVEKKLPKSCKKLLHVSIEPSLLLKLEK